MPIRLSASKTAFIARLLAASASAALRAWVTTPAESCASSGTALTSPWPETVMVRGGGVVSSAAIAGAASRVNMLMPAASAVACEFLGFIDRYSPCDFREPRLALRQNWGGPATKRGSNLQSCDKEGFLPAEFPDRKTGPEGP